jgi:hypothetical protein
MVGTLRDRKKKQQQKVEEDALKKCWPISAHWGWPALAGSTAEVGPVLPAVVNVAAGRRRARRGRAGEKRPVPLAMSGGTTGHGTGHGTSRATHGY